jgi:NAD(P)-dependent dehydrogenase (short-subunit alcohol dehydrogenase family)
VNYSLNAEGDIRKKETVMGSRLQGKVAIVTGSTSGIGEGIARMFAKEGASVVITGRRTEKGANIAREIRDSGGDAAFIHTDITVDEDVDEMIAFTIEKYGRIDILVNNAGTFLHKKFIDTTAEEWDHLLRLDARAYFFTMQKVIPQMEKQGKGAIVNVTSNVAVMPNADFALYSFIKAGLTHLSKVVALEYADKGIRINCLLPGAVMTEMTAGQADNDFISSLVPMGRHSTPEEQAYAAVYLASDESAYVTGSSLVVDGGWYPY